MWLENFPASKDAGYICRSVLEALGFSSASCRSGCRPEGRRYTTLESPSYRAATLLCMFSMMAEANSDVFSLVAPSIMRSRS